MSLRAILLSVGFSAAAHAQVVRVAGSVVDERQSPIQGATVRLTGGESQTTPATGRFQFDQVIPGRYLLTVTAIGYQMQSVELDVTRDTSISVALTRRAVTLDTVVVRPGRLRIKGTAVDSATGDYLLQAQAILYPGGKLVGATSGVFVFDSVAPGAVTLIVEGLEHLPTRVQFDAARDTVIKVALAIDSVALRMIGVQVKRLESRSHAVAMPMASINRDVIAREGAQTVGDLLIRRLFEDPEVVRRASLAGPDAGCFFLDERKVTRDVFNGLLPEMVERIEIYRRGGSEAPSIATGPPPKVPVPRGISGPGSRVSTNRNFGDVQMIRVYTKRYVATLPARPNLPRVIYMQNGVKPVCS